VNQIFTELSVISELVLPAEKIQEIEADKADNHVLECAVEAHADYIVSGDSHLLELKIYRSIQVVSPDRAQGVLPGTGRRETPALVPPRSAC